MASEEQNQSMANALAALLKQPLQVQPPEAEDREGEEAGTSSVKIAGFMLLTFSSAITVSLWNSSLGAVFFLVFSCVDLAMLFHCRRLYARTPPWSHRRELLKVAAWVLTAMLTVTFFQLVELWFVTMGKTENPIMDFQKPRRMA